MTPTGEHLGVSFRAAPAPSNGDSLDVRGRALVVGVVFFLASELMFFAGWFAAYFDLRGHANRWPPAGVTRDLTEPLGGTFVLAASSIAVYMALHALRGRRFFATRLLLAAALACGAMFLAIAVHGWAKAPFSIASSAYGTVVFSMTGFHALHVLAGIVLLGYLLIGVREPAFRAAHHAGAEAIGYYWHFVFVVWLGIFATIYLVR